jgi:predicted HAD superfamily hydrolase
MSAQSEFQCKLADPAITHVSFDVFDTLICRPTRRPDGMYEIVGAAAESITALDAAVFAAVRRRAENEVRVMGLARGDQEIDLADIYNRLCRVVGLPIDFVAKLAAIEERIELENFSLCSPGIELVKAARDSQKHIVFLSDTYFTESFMRVALKDVIEPSDRLLISSAVKLTKHSGDIYRLLSEGLEPRAILHVGDNLRSDVQRALKAGIGTFYVKSGAELARNRGFVLSTAGSDTALSISQGLINKILIRAGDGQSLRDKYQLIGYCALGPFWVGFLDFIEASAERQRVDKLFFLARDGYILQKAFEKSGKRSSEYLSVSRHSLYLAYAHINFEEALPLLLQDYAEATVHEVLLRLVPSDLDLKALKLPQWANDLLDQPVCSPEIHNKLMRLARLLTSQIKQHAANHYEATSNYFRQVGMANIATAGIVDVGWHGSLQVLMHRLLTAMGLRIRLVGMYVGLYEHAKRPVCNDVMSGYLFEYGSNKAAEVLVQSGPSLIEVLHAAPHGTTLGYEEQSTGRISPTYATAEAEEQQYQTYIHLLHRGGLKFLDDFREAMSRIAPHAAVKGSRDYAQNLLRLVSKPTVEEASLLGRLGLHPNFGPASDIIRLAEERGNNGRSMWPIGRSMFHRASHPEWFDEDQYFIERPDVLLAVRRGDFASGYHHFLAHGKNEAEGKL